MIGPDQLNADDLLGAGHEDRQLHGGTEDTDLPYTLSGGIRGFNPGRLRKPAS